MPYETPYDHQAPTARGEVIAATMAGLEVFLSLALTDQEKADAGLAVFANLSPALEATSPPTAPADPPPTQDEIDFYHRRLFEACLRLIPNVVVAQGTTPSPSTTAARALAMAQVAIETGGV